MQETTIKHPKNTSSARTFITHVGRDVFKRRYEILNLQLNKKLNENFSNVYLQIYNHFQTDFGHYFRNLYRILKFIDQTSFSNDSQENFKIQYEYTSMVRAQVSDYELLWLFYNGLSENGIEKFKPLIEKYCFLKNLPLNKIHDPEVIKNYNKSAFEKQE